VLSIPPSAHASYVLNGSYWPDNTHIQYIKDSMTSKDSTGFSNAITAWDGSRAPIAFLAHTSGNYVEMWDENDGNSGYDGYSFQDTSTSFGCNVNGTTVYIITYAGAYLNTYYTNQSSYTSSGAIQSVAAHELGHDVGLAHDGLGNQLMFYSTDRYWNYGIKTPQTDEVNGTTALYNAC
jgi:predicted Zn-dependent protease